MIKGLETDKFSNIVFVKDNNLRGIDVNNRTACKTKNRADLVLKEV